MPEVDIENLRSWIGRERTIEDIITPRLAASLNAVLDVEEATSIGAPAPLGIHWCLAPDIVPMSEIGPDGHPARGGFLPPVPYPRRMWAGGELAFTAGFRVGDVVARHSVVENIEAKSGRSGDLIFVTVRHRYETTRGTALQERQDIVYRKTESSSPAEPPPQPQNMLAASAHTIRIDASPVLLFRYSAITFNGHRIHYDQPYVTTEECYPGLVFHGPLQATLLIRFAATLAKVDYPQLFTFRSIRPLFAGGQISAEANIVDGTVHCSIASQARYETMKASFFTRT